MQQPAADATIAIDDTTIIKPALHHVNLKTTRLDEMIEWYGLVVGLQPNFRNPGIAFLTNDDANHRLEGDIADPSAVESAADGCDTIVNFAAETHVDRSILGAAEFIQTDVLGTYVRLKGQGIVPHAVLDHGLTLSFYYLDPDGNSVELQVDNYGDWEKSTEYIRTDAGFAENPIGHFADPDAVVAAREAGATPDEIHERAMRDEFPPTTPPDMRVPA